MKTANTFIKQLSARLHKYPAYIYMLAGLLLLLGVGTVLVVNALNTHQSSQEDTKPSTVKLDEQPKNEDVKVSDTTASEPVDQPVESEPQTAVSSNNVTTQQKTAPKAAPAPAPAQTKPVGTYTSGQTFCSSSLVWGSITEANFSHWKGQPASAQYQLEATISGQMRVLYTGTISTSGNGTFDVRPPSSEVTWAPGVRSGDVLYVHILAPFDVYSKPYYVESFMQSCGS